jgi:hypothetical protein
LRYKPAAKRGVARELMGTADQLVGFHQSMIKIDDSEVVKISGKTHHPIVKRTDRTEDRTEDRIAGTVFEITDEELANADKYEVADYKRVSASLANLISPRLLDKPTFNSL